jgi:Ser/Thr protein kinase RdoA (MazF antagonist)
VISTLNIEEIIPDTALSTPAPVVPTPEIQANILRLYGIGCSVKPLGGERDQNCLVEASDGRRYVFKVSNQSESISVVDFQIAALEHIGRASPSPPVPQVIKTLGGRSHDKITPAGGSPLTVRLLTYLDGIQIKETNRTAAQRGAMGRGLGELDLALAGFTHPGARHDLLWNVATAHRLADKLDAIVPPPRRALAAFFMDRFIAQVLPRLPALRSQVVHNDYHLYNVLVRPEAPSSIVGIIDFGDMVWAPLVGEVATAAAFQMAGNADPLAAAAEFVAAYQSVLPLTAEEQDIVADLMTTRHLITVLISEWRAARYPENRAYIMRHNPGSWDALNLVADLSRNDVRDRLLAGTQIGSAE